MGLPASGSVNWDSPKIREAEALLEDGEREQFRSFVESLFFHSAKRGWAPLRQYAVYADMIREGWSGPPCSAENRPVEPGRSGG